MRAVANAFREAEHSFLMPPQEQPLHQDTVLDVSQFRKPLPPAKDGQRDLFG